MSAYWQPGMYQEEIEHLNRERPLNQVARQALVSVRENPDPGYPYALQLLEWALREGKIKLAPRQSRGEYLRETVTQMFAWNPETVMQVFEESAEGDAGIVVEPGPVNPVGLAEDLLDQLDSRLIAAGAYPDQEPNL